MCILTGCVCVVEAENPGGGLCGREPGAEGHGEHRERLQKQQGRRRQHARQQRTQCQH